MTLKEFFNSKKPIKLGNPIAPMGDFPLVNASDVIVDYDKETGEEIRLDKKLKNLGNGNVELDTTLEVDGAAADAKAVGDRITKTLGDIHSVLERI